MKVLFASSEIFPYAKSGGLSDVASALPKALEKLSIDVVSVMPRYGFMDRKKFKLFKECEIQLSGSTYQVAFYYDKKTNTYFVDTPLLSETLGMYGENGVDYPNNDIRFGLFSAAIVELALLLQANVLHLNDWQSALAAFFVKERGLAIKTLFTIHNLAYQGVFDRNALDRLGIDKKYFHIDGFEFYGKTNFLKAAIAWSDKVTTVSPSYAEEIQGYTYGCGLDGFLRFHGEKLSGIINGIDQNHFNPRKDKLIPFCYDENSLDVKHKNKVEFLKTTPLKDPRKPLFVMVSRLVAQKGIALVLENIDAILQEKINFYIVGEGSEEYTEQLEKLMEVYDNLYFHKGFDEALSHQVYAAADFLLMPSKFEPCGLSQFIAMRYGAIPLTHCVGGLKDSVHEDLLSGAKGIVFEDYTKEHFLEAFTRALALKKDTKKFKSWASDNMQCDFSFNKSANEYVELYKSIL
ncbi:MAG: glycogen/starch synthase [Sulfurimonadaceae bacterium]|jgi:starch synthase|nr:glycogen/starch synthase [Sulfurimonadaceae bacterium]